ncbi:MAG: DUF4392 domain-containing protein [Lachnospiraceae bacterium]|nr:DUF4392 domain-containing protein [Lachnospiraceae bacterium]
MSNAARCLPPSDRDYSIEDIVLRYSGRGMTILQRYLHSGYCDRAAKKLLALERGNILLTTGFCVSGRAETDGPPGTVILAHALKKLGFHPAIVTDQICRGLFESEGFPVEYAAVDADARIYQKLLDRYRPVCLIAIERCGRNLEEDYANMKGISIARQTAQIDIMFDLAAREGILTIGIGDGGNEIGMGNLKDVIEEKLSLIPCTVKVNELIIATTSNWGAYALAASLSIKKHQHLLMSYHELAEYLERIVALGCIDGVTKKQEPSVDGFPPEIEREILGTLHLISSAAS